MKTRSRRSTAAENAPKEESSPIKVAKATPKKQNASALVADILNQITEENAKAPATNNQANEAVEVKTSQPKQREKEMRGKPKSGRPWKEVKQK